MDSGGGAGADCLCRGTRVLSERGEVAVEDLVIGQKLVTRSGRLRPIRWIGRRSFDERFARGNPEILPVLVKAGALDENQPTGDLYLSPNHALLIDGGLVKADRLVNGISIVRCAEPDRLDYFSIELDSHDVIHAEGVPVESYLDRSDRGMFHNAHEFAVLYPGGGRVDNSPCAPTVDGGGGLHAVKRKIDARCQLPPDGAADPLECEPQGLDEAVRQVLEQAIATEADAAESAEALDPIINLLLAQAGKLIARKSEIGAGPGAPRQDRPRALFIDDRVPRCGEDAGSNAILGHMRVLAQIGYEVGLVARDMAPAADSAVRELQRLGFRCFAPPDYDSVEDVLIRSVAAFDLIYLHRVAVATQYGRLVRRYCPRSRVVYSVADLHYLRTARGAAIEGDPGLLAESQRLKAEELAAAGAADAVITHSGYEAALLAAQVPGAAVHVVPWPIAARRRRAGFAERHGVAFIGGYGHRPNLDAARWLIGEIMPRVRRSEAAIECLLVGSHLPLELSQLCGDGVVAIGRVDSLDEVFDRVRLTVAPLRYGAGVKGKVVDSLAAGIPCVLTPIAAEGLDLPPPLPNYIGADPASLAELICRLHADEDENRKCAEAGLRFVEETLSAARIDTLMRAVLGAG